MQTQVPLSREIVLIGGGHAHALLLRQWGMKPLPGARLTVINPDATAPYTGMLPGFVAGHYPRDALEIDIVKLARFAQARMIFGKVTAIDRDARLLTVPGRARIAYDIASLDIGITSDMPSLKGFSEYGIAAKPLGPFAERWQAHLDGEAGPVVVIGGGVAGVELALAMEHALHGRGSVTVVEAETALRGIGHATRDRLLTALHKAKITLLEGQTVTEVGKETVTLSDGEILPAALTVGAAGARPFKWLEDTGLELENGFISVDENLRSLNDPNIFAVGDCAHLSHAPRPKAGVFAVRAAPILFQNLRAAVSEEKQIAFRPQSHYLKLISLGGKSALADKWGRSVGGTWAWRWKDHIDQEFMDRLNKLPEMKAGSKGPRASAPADATDLKPLCGGCGAKVGGSTLDEVLRQLPPTNRDDVVTGTGDDAAVLVIGGQKQVLTTDHLRAFWDDPFVMSRITALHAMGDIWAMGAKPQVVLTHITLPHMTDTLQHNWLREVMEAATEVFASEGASIVGGHTTMGAELQLGFTISGLAEEPVTLSGAKPGDVLLLTRPIGSGTLLAAEMERRANGDDIAALLAQMTTSQADVARLLAPVAHAMTDITGFGLVGHAARIGDASEVTLRIDPAAVPFYAGAEHLASSGVRSSIWQANRQTFIGDFPDTPRMALMFDPQTAGGLLAALPEAQAKQILTRIRDMGHNAAIIASVTDREDKPLLFD